MKRAASSWQGYSSPVNTRHPPRLAGRLDAVLDLLIAQLARVLAFLVGVVEATDVPPVAGPAPVDLLNRLAARSLDERVVQSQDARASILLDDAYLRV